MRTQTLALFLAAASLAACERVKDPLAPDARPSFSQSGTEPTVVPIAVGGATVSIWPFASADLATPDDPINLVFGGEADPRDIRNALLGLDGSRGAPFPPVFPFNCTWSDAIGGLMAGFGETTKWAAGVVQLQCGSYGPIRFHLRLFRVGAITAGNAHFEVLIPGTADHQVLSWELAEQLVTYDMARTGLLGAAPSVTGTITPAPTHRSIPAVIYNDLPDDLRALIGGPPVPAGDVGIANDGRATTFVLAGRAPAVAPTAHQELTLTYGQVIPKPFCSAGPTDFLLVQGPVTLIQDVSASGGFRMTFRARGELSAVPFDIFTGQPSGDPLKAVVLEQDQGYLDDHLSEIRGLIEQGISPERNPAAGRLRVTIAVGTERPAEYDRRETCPSR